MHILNLSAFLILLTRLDQNNLIKINENTTFYKVTFVYVFYIIQFTPYANNVNCHNTITYGKEEYETR